MKLAPIVLFVYNRPDHTLETLRSLEKNVYAKESILYIFADGAKEGVTAVDAEKIAKVKQIIKNVKWSKQTIIKESDTNKGLARSIVDGVTEVVNKYGKVIVLEDDLLLSPYFLKYMNEALDLYKDEEKVMHVGSYIPTLKEVLPETFFYNETSCWGWATWKRAWDKYNPSAVDLLEKLNKRRDIGHFNLDGAYNFYEHLLANAEGRMNTWAILWHTSVYLLDGLCLHPGKSLVLNKGFDGSGTNCGSRRINDKLDCSKMIKVDRIELKESDKARDAISRYYFSMASWKGRTKITGWFSRLMKNIFINNE